MAGCVPCPNTIMTKAYEVFIDREGKLTYVYDDALMEALRDLGPAETRRASHVEPGSDGKHWFADMTPLTGNGPVLGPFSSRQEALTAEAAWLSAYLTAAPPQERKGNDSGKGALA